MAASISSIFRKFIIAIILIAATLYIAGSLTPYINPNNIQFLTYTALVFPYLLLAMLGCCVIGYLVIRKYCWVLFLLVFIGYKNILSTTGFHFKKQFVQQKQPKTFRLLSWNVNEFANSQVQMDTLNNLRRNILNFIKSANADVLCFQDYRDFFEGSGNYSNAKYIQDTLHYPYYYPAIDGASTNKLFRDGYGTAIFSKYPIIDTGKIGYELPNIPETLGYADIQFPNKVVRFYSSHLLSMRLTYERKELKKNYTFIQDDTAILFNKTKVETIANFDSLHIQQARVIKQQLNACNKPFVFCADLNSVPSSYVYHYLSRGLNDAFLQNGQGWGASYDGLSPSLRIDVVLMSPQLKATQFTCPKIKASDHFPLVTDIGLR